METAAQIPRQEVTSPLAQACSDYEEESSDDDDSSDKEPPAKRAPAKKAAPLKAAAKKSPAKEEESSDNDDSSSKEPPAKRAPAKKSSAAKPVPPTNGFMIWKVCVLLHVPLCVLLLVLLSVQSHAHTIVSIQAHKLGWFMCMRATDISVYSVVITCLAHHVCVARNGGVI